MTHTSLDFLIFVSLGPRIHLLVRRFLATTPVKNGT